MLYDIFGSCCYRETIVKAQGILGQVSEIQLSQEGLEQVPPLYWKAGHGDQEFCLQLTLGKGDLWTLSLFFNLTHTASWRRFWFLEKNYPIYMRKSPVFWGAPLPSSFVVYHIRWNSHWPGWEGPSNLSHYPHLLLFPHTFCFFPEPFLAYSFFPSPPGWWIHKVVFSSWQKEPRLLIGMAVSMLQRHPSTLSSPFFSCSFSISYRVPLHFNLDPLLPKKDTIASLLNFKEWDS